MYKWSLPPLAFLTARTIYYIILWCACLFVSLTCNTIWNLAGIWQRRVIMAPSLPWNWVMHRYFVRKTPETKREMWRDIQAKEGSCFGNSKSYLLWQLVKCEGIRYKPRSRCSKRSWLKWSLTFQVCSVTSITVNLKYSCGSGQSLRSILLRDRWACLPCEVHRSCNNFLGKSWFRLKDLGFFLM